MFDKKQTLIMLSEGETVKNIANKMNLNRRTLEGKIREFRKMQGCASTTQLVAKFIRKGLICFALISFAGCTKILPCWHCTHVNSLTGQITTTKYYCGKDWKTKVFKDSFGNELQTQCYK